MSGNDAAMSYNFLIMGRHPLFYFTLRNNHCKSDIESEPGHDLLVDSIFCMCNLSFKFPGIY